MRQELARVAGLIALCIIAVFAPTERLNGDDAVSPAG